VGRQLFIFDLDGTLVDSAADLAAAANRARAEFGLAPLSVGTIAGFVGDGIRTMMERVFQDRPEVDLDRVVALQKAHYRAHLCDATRPYPGVEPGLARLQARGHALAVATNKPVEMADALLSALRLRSRFSAVLGGGSGLELKPHPAMIETIRQRLGCAASDTWMIGDHRTDLEAARRAGVHGILVRYGIGDPGPERPERAFDTFDALMDHFVPEGKTA